MNRLRNFIAFMQLSRWLKYVIVVVIGVISVGFLGDNSLWSHYKNKQRIVELQREIDKYNQRNDADQRTLRELSSNPKAIEKIARERYFMKMDDEDIFVLSDDQRTPNPQSDETVD